MGSCPADAVGGNKLGGVDQDSVRSGEFNEAHLSLSIGVRQAQRTHRIKNVHGAKMAVRTMISSGVNIFYSPRR